MRWLREDDIRERAGTAHAELQQLPFAEAE